MEKKRVFLIDFLLSGLLILSACGLKTAEEEQYTPKEFPLSIEFDKTDYRIGDTVSFTLTITNNCGKNVTLYSNGNMPCADFQNENNKLQHSEISQLNSQSFKKDEKLSREFSFSLKEAGTYILDAHYTIAINNSDTESWFKEKLDDIEITVTP